MPLLWCQVQSQMEEREECGQHRTSVPEVRVCVCVCVPKHSYVSGVAPGCSGLISGPTRSVCTGALTCFLSRVGLNPLRVMPGARHSLEICAQQPCAEPTVGPTLEEEPAASPCTSGPCQRAGSRQVMNHSAQKDIEVIGSEQPLASHPRCRGKTGLGDCKLGKKILSPQIKASASGSFVLFSPLVPRVQRAPSILVLLHSNPSLHRLLSTCPLSDSSGPLLRPTGVRPASEEGPG